MMSLSQSALHKQIVPQLLRPFECPLCFKTFQKQNHLTRHIKIHSGERQHKCPYCGKAFLRSDNLKKHVRIHTGEKFPCRFCNKGFTDSSNLIKHIRTHTGEGRHHCKFCLKHFAGLSALQKHLQEHEEMQFSTSTLLVKTERIDSCDYSSYMEENPGHLNKKELSQQSQRRASPLLLERNQNLSCDEPYLDTRNSFSSNLLSQIKHQEPFIPAVSGNVKKTVNPFLSTIQGDTSSLHKQCQVLPQEPSPHLTTEKCPIPFSLKNESLAAKVKVLTSDLLQEQNHLAHHVNVNQDLSLWQCVLCLEEFPSCFLLLSHLKRHVTDNVQIPDSWDHDNATMEDSSAEQLNCRYCQKVFTQQSELFAHMDLTLCKNCGKIFACCMLLEKHKETCKINWMDKDASNESENNNNNNNNNNSNNDNDNNAVCSKNSDIQPENYEETESENLTLDTKDFPLLTAVKQEIIFSDTENLITDQDLSRSKSPLAAVDLNLSLNKAFSPTLTSQASSQIKENIEDSPQMVTNTNILSPQQKTHSITNQEIPAETVSENTKKSQGFHSGLTASLDIPSKPKSLEDKLVSVNPQEPLTLPDSQLQNLTQEIADSTKDFSLNISVYEAYKCAKAALDNPNSSLQQNNIQSSGTFWCQNCGKNFRSIFEIREHLKLFEKFINKFCPENSHKLESLKKCLKIQQPYSFHSRLERNLVDGDSQLEFHNSENAQIQSIHPPSISQNVSNGPLLLTCDVCHKTFARSTQLNRHRKIHLGIKNHKCTFCPKTFLRSDNLRKHLRIHLGIKQYACMVCKRRFTDSSNLIKHQRIHNNNRQGYSCNLCHRRFLNYQSLCKHIQTHEPTLIEGQSTVDEGFPDNGVQSASSKIPQKASNVCVTVNSENQQSRQLDASVCDKGFFESQSSGTNQLKMQLATNVHSSVNNNSNLTNVSFDSHDLSFQSKHLTDTFKQDQIPLRSTELCHDPKYKTFSPSPEELLAYFKPHNVTRQSLAEEQQKPKRLGSPTSCNGTKQTEEPKNEEWNNDVLQLIVPLPQESALKSEIPEPSENSSINSMFDSLTEQVKDNLTLDRVFGDKMIYNSPMQSPLECPILEQQQQVSCASEISKPNTKSDQHFNISTTNFPSLFASCDSAKEEPISENLNSDLTASSACFNQNTTEDKLEMSAYYSTQTSANNLEKPKPQLADMCKQQDKKITKYSGIHGTFENSLNSTDDNSMLGNLATYLSQLRDCSLLTKSG